MLQRLRSDPSLAPTITIQYKLPLLLLVVNVRKCVWGGLHGFLEWKRGLSAAGEPRLR